MCMYPHLIKWHLDRFSRFCWVHLHDQHRQTYRHHATSRHEMQSDNYVNCCAVYDCNSRSTSKHKCVIKVRIYNRLSNKLLHYTTSRKTWVCQHQKGKPFWLSMEQEMMGGSGISWTICRSFSPHSRYITMQVSHHSGRMLFLRSCRPSNSVRALKASSLSNKWLIYNFSDIDAATSVASCRG